MKLRAPYWTEVAIAICAIAALLWGVYEFSQRSKENEHAVIAKLIETESMERKDADRQMRVYLNQIANIVEQNAKELTIVATNQKMVLNRLNMDGRAPE